MSGGSDKNSVDDNGGGGEGGGSGGIEGLGIDWVLFLTGNEGTDDCWCVLGEGVRPSMTAECSDSRTSGEVDGWYLSDEKVVLDLTPITENQGYSP